MKAILVVFNSGKIKKNEHSKFFQGLYGVDIKSHKGKYVFHKKGLLEDIAHIKLIKGAIIVAEKNRRKVIAYMKSYGAEIYIFKVTVPKEMEKQLEDPRK